MAESSAAIARTFSAPSRVMKGMAQDYEALLRRVERLEKRNRLLLGVLSLLPVFAIAGWQAAPVQDVLRVRRLEVVDLRGVPMVTLEPDRGEAGGAIILRDRQGEKRGWWRVAPDSGSFTMSADAGGDTSNTVGLGVAAKSARVSLIGPKGASATTSIENEQPRVDLYDSNGVMLFGAPWRRK